MTVLHVDGVVKDYVAHLRGGVRRRVLDGVSFEVLAGTCTLVHGPSGAGKSSLLRCIYGAAVVEAGAIRYRDSGGRVHDLARIDERVLLGLRRAEIALATQFLSVVPRVSAHDLVVAAGAASDEAHELLASLGLDCALHGAPPATFSGGERQIVNLAIALAQPRRLILLDEITASLDAIRKARVAMLLARRKAEGSTLLVVSHEPQVLHALIDRTIDLSGGRAREIA